MPRYLSTSPYEQVLMGLSVGVDGTVVHPADGRPQPADGSTVVLAEGDEVETAQDIHFPGAERLDPPAPTGPPADPQTPTTPDATGATA